MAITRKPQSLSVSERDRELELGSKTLFYKDCSLGSVKTRLTTSPCEATDE